MNSTSADDLAAAGSHTAFTVSRLMSQWQRSGALTKKRDSSAAMSERLLPEHIQAGIAGL